MIIVKVEYEGGRWEWKEFYDERAAAIYLIKNKDVKLRLAGKTNNNVKNAINEIKNILKK